MPQLEYGDYYKFVISCGIGLIFVSVGLPWLFLHDPFDLLIETSKIANLTPQARDVVLHRQRIVSVIIILIPYASAVVGASGIVMTLYGLINWRKRQTIRDTVEEIDLGKKRIEYEQMTQGQIIEEARADVLNQGNAILPPAAASQNERVDAAVEAYLESENTFLDALESRLPEGYELLRHQRAMSYTFDAVVRPIGAGAPEYMIDIKKLGSNANIRPALDALKEICIGADWANFDSKIMHIPMLIAVVEDISAQQMEDVSQFIRNSTGHPTSFGRSMVRMIAPRRLATLSARDIPSIFDSSQRLVVLSDKTEFSSPS